MRHDIRPATATSRRCVVKARYVPMANGGARGARSHLAYIERDGVEQDGSKGRLFDRSGEVDRETFSVKIAGEKRQFRFIVAPEDGNELDLRAYTNQLMTRMEKDLGRELRWAAVCHYNTDNPHVHIVVRGVDARGAELRIDRGYISEGLRLRGQELATRELGPRTEFEAQLQRSREATAERLTTIDRRIAPHLSREGSLDLRAVARASGLSRPDALARLATLERLQLAERTSPTTWQLAEGWQETLRQLGERGDIIKRMHRALQGRAVAYRVFEQRDGAQIEGVIRSKGLHDEQTGEPCIVVETPRREAVYVRLDRVTAETVREGAAIRLRCEKQAWVKGTDFVIQREATTNGGIYRPADHLKRLGTSPIAIDAKWVWPDDVVAANQRRLERLERYKLVSRLPDGSWRVPPNLTEILSSREQTHPRFRIQIEPLVPSRDRSRERGPGLER
jgi:type IV secretory pathway VirD2 relaxase